jgi:RimJ/RimL family protein N-acetyltransferase
VAVFNLLTDRLLLREWRSSDRGAFATMNSDPAVMEFLGPLLTALESNALVDRFEREFTERGFCPWAVESRSSGEFLGFVGLHEVPEYLPFAPAVEVGWRLAAPHWGRGFATEAARASLRFAFESVGLDEVVSMTAVHNLRSRRLMERIGMSNDRADDFEHPKVRDPELASHVLYRLRHGSTAS